MNDFRLGDLCVKVGKLWQCPFCEESAFVLSQLSVSAHLRKHVRRGDLTEADRLETLKVLFPKTGANK